MNKKVEFKQVTPETCGVSSAKVLEFISTLDDIKLRTHSILFAKGDNIFSECYYKPFDVNFLHRMYSVSKTFVAMAVGLAITEGILDYDASIVSFFPEFKNENIDEYYKECTVRNMLSMQSNIAQTVSWWGNFKSRIEAYYSVKTDKIPGTVFYYDSIGSFLLGCIIEKLTGKCFLEYLKEKVLLEIGFSKESYVLKEPGGYSVGDSGVMCTTRDLFIFTRFIMKMGNWNGKQYIDRKFMEDAISMQVVNDIEGMSEYYGNQGYGYLTWKTHPDGFSLIGAGDQLAICDMKNDLTFIITSDNQSDGNSARRIIYHEYYKHFLPYVKENKLPEDAEAYDKLKKYLSSTVLISRKGEKNSPLEEKINNKKYKALENSLGISYFRLNFSEKMLEFKKDGKVLRLPFSLCENKLIDFSLKDRAVADKMGYREIGTYSCASSAAWVTENQFSILCQVIDTYMGGLYITISFKDEKATFVMKNSGQYVFSDAEGYVIGIME